MDCGLELPAVDIMTWQRSRFRRSGTPVSTRRPFPVDDRCSPLVFPIQAMQTPSFLCFRSRTSVSRLLCRASELAFLGTRAVAWPRRAHSFFPVQYSYRYRYRTVCIRHMQNTYGPSRDTPMEGNRTANVSARLRIGTELFPLHRRRGVDPALPVQNDSPANQEGAIVRDAPGWDSARLFFSVS